MNTERSERAVKLCIAAGMMGAIAGASCKAAVSTTMLNQYLSINSEIADITLSVLFYLGYVLFTWSSWGYYVDGMNGIPSLQAAVLNSASNSLSMGFLGWLLFQEHLSINWMFGVGLMLIGVFLLSKSPLEKQKKA